MQLLDGLKGAIRRRRTFDACQLAGFSLLLIALSIWIHPVSIAFTWFNQWLGISISILGWSCLFASFGWLLAWQQRLSHLLFVVLTLPVLMFAVVQVLFAAETVGASFSGGLTTGILYGWMQWSHGRQEGHRAFMRAMQAGDDS